MNIVTLIILSALSGMLAALCVRVDADPIPVKRGAPMKWVVRQAAVWPPEVQFEKGSEK